jgi:predicted DNA-binding protein
MNKHLEKDPMAYNDTKHRGPVGPSGMGRRRKTSTISFRIEGRLKERLQAIAARRGRTLSSLIERILKDSIDSPEGGSAVGAIKEERRNQTRKKVVLPARWKFVHGENAVEHDVIVKNINAGGAYTEYHNGHSFLYFKNLQTYPFALVLRMPGSSEPVALDCVARHFHITQEGIGVGLEFSWTVSTESQATLTEFLA